ncbi:MAG TPA: DUF5060 domain-containing protein [Thermoanaerobaculia bacterium]|nr:DUF5060 domain-containing protein [Thermoanaerobaculia bacterium]
MERRQLSGLALIVGALLSLAGAGRAAAAVPRFDTAEIVLHSTAPYDGAQGSPNPFTDVALTAQVTSPGGAVYTVQGFFDGDGAGGQVGDVFKVRVFADEIGTWTWTTTSDDPGLDGKAGSFECAGTLAGAFGEGPIAAHATYPRSFRHRAGGAVYLLAKYLDTAAPSPLQFSQTLFSEARSESDRAALLARHAAMKLNKINVYLANVGDYGTGVPTTPWLGPATASDKQRFDLSRWRTYERWVGTMRDAGFATQLWFFADNSDFGDLPAADRDRLVRYGMARLSGYANTLFTLMTEWQEGWTQAEVHAAMDHLQQHNPWGRLASVHGLPGDFSFPAAPWADYLVVQVGVGGVDHVDVHQSTLRNRALAAKPLQEEEFWLGQESLAGRQMAWAAFTGGAAGSGTGAFLRQLAELVATVPFERMAPADPLVLAGSAYALAEPGEAYVFYLPDGGAIEADLRGVSGSFDADWFDPRTGAFQAVPAVEGGAVRSFTAPAAGDWTLRLLREPDPPPPPPPPPDGSFHTLAPCRLLDTREPGQGPALASDVVRLVTLAGRCGVPAGAAALSLNVTVTAPGGPGHLTLAPGGVGLPATSTLNFGAGATRANNAILSLAPDGSGTLAALAHLAGGGTVHLILDVNGYFD